MISNKTKPAAHAGKVNSRIVIARTANINIVKIKNER